MKLIDLCDILISARCIKTCAINKKNTLKLQALKREENNIIRTERYNCYEECFVTNSLMGVMPVRQLGNICFPHRTRAEEVRNTYESEKMSL